MMGPCWNTAHKVVSEAKTVQSETLAGSIPRTQAVAPTLEKRCDSGPETCPICEERRTAGVDAETGVSLCAECSTLPIEGKRDELAQTDGGADQKFCRACGWVEPVRAGHPEYGRIDACPNCGPFGAVFNSKADLVDYDHESAHYMREALTEGGRSIFAIDAHESLTPEGRLVVEETNAVLVARDVHPLVRQATMWALGDAAEYPERWAVEHAPDAEFSTATRLLTDGGRDVSLANLSAFQRDVLWVLAKTGEQKGLDVKERLQNYYESEVNHAQIYPNLDELVDRGLVDKSKIDGRTNGYSLTEAGRRALTARQTWTGGSEADS